MYTRVCTCIYPSQHTHTHWNVPMRSEGGQVGSVRMCTARYFWVRESKILLAEFWSPHFRSFSWTGILGLGDAPEGEMKRWADEMEAWGFVGGLILSFVFVRVCVWACVRVRVYIRETGESRPIAKIVGDSVSNYSLFPQLTPPFPLSRACVRCIFRSILSGAVTFALCFACSRSFPSGAVTFALCFACSRSHHVALALVSFCSRVASLPGWAHFLVGLTFWWGRRSGMDRPSTEQSEY